MCVCVCAHVHAYANAKLPSKHRRQCENCLFIFVSWSSNIQFASNLIREIVVLLKCKRWIELAISKNKKNRTFKMYALLLELWKVSNGLHVFGKRRNIFSIIHTQILTLYLSLSHTHPVYHIRMFFFSGAPTLYVACTRFVCSFSRRQDAGDGMSACFKIFGSVLIFAHGPLSINTTHTHAAFATK